MKIFVRADASLLIGTGHVMRCLTLATALRRVGHRVEFICRELEGALSAYLEQRGFRVHRLPRSEGSDPAVAGAPKRSAWLGTDWCTDAEQVAAILAASDERVTWLIVDQYALDWEWESYQRPYVENIFVIDDLADRQHDCDLLLDQNFPLLPTRYQNLVPAPCHRLLGPSYALLREEFKLARATLRERKGDLNRILVFFGGVDMSNESAKVLHALEQPAYRNIAVDLIAGATNPHIEELRGIVGAMPNATIHVQVDNMAELMARADFAICAAGSASLERFCVGLPTAMITTADNQKDFAEAMAAQRYGLYIGEREQVTQEDMMHVINLAMGNKELLRSLSERSMALVDGLGCERVVASLVHGTRVRTELAWNDE